MKSAYAVDGIDTISHELGHGFGLGHASYWSCPIGVDITNAAKCNNGDTDEYGDDYEVMAYHAHHLNSAHKEILGWMNSYNVQTVTQSGTFNLAPLEVPSNGFQAIKIARPNSDYLYIDYRQPIGFDLQTSIFRFKSGASVHTLGAGGLQTYLHDPSGQLVRVQPVLAVGSTFTDPLSGATITTLSADSSNLKISVTLPAGSPVPMVNGPATNLRVAWNRPVGYLSAVGQKKNIDWSDIHYVVDFKCTYGSFCSNTYNQWGNCSTWPRGTCPPYDTVDTSANVLVAGGFSYTYRVWILTKRDGDPNSVQAYLWVPETYLSNDCLASLCSKNISWPRATYRVSLFRTDNGQSACGGTVGCQDLIVTDGGPDKASNVTYRGLPTGVTFKADVNVNDNLGNTHLLQRLENVGQSENYFQSCFSAGTSCSISNPAGIGPFIGYEPILFSVKANDANGAVILGPAGANVAANGSFGRGWDWRYSIALFPAVNGSCLNKVIECVVDNFSGNDPTFSVIKGGIKPGISYRTVVCVPDCGTGKAIFDPVPVVSAVPQPAGVSEMTSASFTCPDGVSLDAVFRWTAAGGAIYDQVFLDYQYQNDPFTPVDVTNMSGGSYVAHNIAPSVNYGYRVNSHIANGDWLPSRLISFVTPSCGTIGQVVSQCMKSDVNHDGYVTILDLNLMAQHFGEVKGDGKYDSLFDIDGDGRISILDMVIAAKYFGKKC